jgi:outer membrane protein assembly factor BamB
VTITAGVLILGGLLLLVWITLFSRLPLKIRLLTWAVLLAAVALFFSAFRYRGVTGDVVPIFEPRWKGEIEVLPGEELSEFALYSYPQFLGPHRNGTVPGVRLARDWETQPPRLIWRRPVGKGWSAFAVVGDTAVTQEQHGEEERIVCYDLKTAEVRWSFGYPASYSSPLAGDGPRATPTIVNGRVYAVGGTGLLHALDLEDGRLIWSRDVLEDNGASNPGWGKSCSPLVVDGLVVVSAGGPGGKSLVAYSEDTGEIVWRGGDDHSSYASAVVTTLAGVRQIVILNAGSVVGHDPEDGRVLWSHPVPGGQPIVAQPLPLPGDRLLVSIGYGIGSRLFDIRPGPGDQLEAELVWETPRLKAKFSNLVFYDGFVYGLDDGILVCLDPETGKLRWKRGRYGHGQVLLVDDLLLVQTETGEILLVEPSPEELRVLTSFRIMDGKIWNSPTLAGPYLLVRTEREAALFELPLGG